MFLAVPTKICHRLSNDNIGELVLPVEKKCTVSCLPCRLIGWQTGNRMTANSFFGSVTWEQLDIGLLEADIQLLKVNPCSSV